MCFILLFRGFLLFFYFFFFVEFFVVERSLLLFFCECFYFYLFLLPDWIFNWLSMEEMNGRNDSNGPAFRAADWFISAIKLLLLLDDCFSRSVSLAVSLSLSLSLLFSHWLNSMAVPLHDWLRLLLFSIEHCCCRLIDWFTQHVSFIITRAIFFIVL